MVESPASEEGVEFENVSRSSYDKLKQRTQAQRQGADPAAADAAFMALLNLLLQKVCFMFMKGVFLCLLKSMTK